MHITPTHIVHLAQSADGFDNAALTMRTAMTQGQIDGMNERRDLSVSQWNQLRDFYSETLNKPITLNACALIMALHPKAKLYLLGGDVGDTDVNSMLLNALSQFVLGCDWPVGGDYLSDREMEVFHTTLCHQYNQLVIRF